MVVFAKGAWYALDDLCSTDYDIVGLDWLHDPAEAYKIAQAKGKIVQGNMDPGVLYGDKSSITRAVQIMVDGFGNGKQGWICNLGHGKMKLKYSYTFITDIEQASHHSSTRRSSVSTSKKSTAFHNHDQPTHAHPATLASPAVSKTQRYISNRPTRQYPQTTIPDVP